MGLVNKVGICPILIFFSITNYSPMPNPPCPIPNSPSSQQKLI
ncbi:MAG: hypothetical protein AAF630_08590 [Cyanobacteria bacterium P01_C01_bin.38]